MILAFAINAICIIGLHESTREEMIGERLASAINYLAGDFWSKPICDCITCMASIWGSTGFLIYGELDWIYLPIWILALAGTTATYGNVFYRE